MNHGLFVRAKPVKLVQENINFCDLVLDRVLGWNTESTLHERKETSKLGSIKSVCTSKDTIKEMMRQATDWEKIFANYLSDKGLVSGVYKELLQMIIIWEMMQFKHRQKIWINPSPKKIKNG